jgi:hypothetical protein
MIYEFALEPALVARWHDRREYQFFDEKFGGRAGRLISAYPKKWKKLVWEVFSAGPRSADQNAQMRMTELIQFLWQNSVKRKSTFTEIENWLERAEAEHAERPFRAIVALTNPRTKAFVITADRLITDGHELWSIPDVKSTPRNAEELARAVSPILKLCRAAILVDPYFDPTKRQFRDPLEAVLLSCCDNVCGLEGLTLELHTSIDRHFESWERGDDRDSTEEERVHDTFVRNCIDILPGLIPVGMTLRVVVWTQRVNGERLHNRYVLTDIGSVMFGMGLDQSENSGSNESDDITLLSESQHNNRLRQYKGSPPAFELVGSPIDIRGKKDLFNE